MPPFASFRWLFLRLPANKGMRSHDASSRTALDTAPNERVAPEGCLVRRKKSTGGGAHR